MENDQEIISDEEKEILKEIMNIAFGNATSALAEIVDIYIILSVPHIDVIQSSHLPDYIKNVLKDYKSVDIIKQTFWGKFNGDAFLVFSSGASKALVTILQKDSDQTANFESIDTLEKETFIETGNIVIGACIGKLAELLGDVVTYSPPVAIIEKSPVNSMPDGPFESDYTAIILKTVFRFEKENLSGFLFLIVGGESVEWLKKALYEFINQYK